MKYLVYGFVGDLPLAFDTWAAAVSRAERGARDAPGTTFTIYKHAGTVKSEQVVNLTVEHEEERS